MGASASHLLQHPVTGQYLIRRESSWVRTGSCEMQGYRAHMEDGLVQELCMTPAPASQNHVDPILDRKRKFPIRSKYVIHDQTKPGAAAKQQSQAETHGFGLLGVFDGHGGRVCSSFFRVMLPREVAALGNPMDPSQLACAVMKLDRMFRAAEPETSQCQGSTALFAVFRPLRPSDPRPPAELREFAVDPGLVSALPEEHRRKRASANNKAQENQNKANSQNQASQSSPNSASDAPAAPPPAMQAQAQADSQPQNPQKQSQPQAQSQSQSQSQDAKQPSPQASSASSASSSSASSSSSSSSGRKKRRYLVVVGNVGDSRALLIRRNGSFSQLSRDHTTSLPQELRRITNAGGYVSDNRVNGELAMSRAVGDWQFKSNLQHAQEDQILTALPEFLTLVAQEGDLLVLCCDGLTERVPTAQIAGLLHHLVYEAEGVSLTQPPPLGGGDPKRNQAAMSASASSGSISGVSNSSGANHGGANHGGGSGVSNSSNNSSFDKNNNSNNNSNNTVNTGSGGGAGLGAGVSSPPGFGFRSKADLARIAALACDAALGRGSTDNMSLVLAQFQGHYREDLATRCWPGFKPMPPVQGQENEELYPVRFVEVIPENDGSAMAGMPGMSGGSSGVPREASKALGGQVASPPNSSAAGQGDGQQQQRVNEATVFFPIGEQYLPGPPHKRNRAYERAFRADLELGEQRLSRYYQTLQRDAVELRKRLLQQQQLKQQQLKQQQEQQQEQQQQQKQEQQQQQPKQHKQQRRRSSVHAAAALDAAAAQEASRR